MLEPRPAILEANTQLRNEIKVDYFLDNKICPVYWDFASNRLVPEKKSAERYRDKRCLNSAPHFEVLCGDGSNHERHVCTITGDPDAWRRSRGMGGKLLGKLADKLQIPESMWETNLPDAMDAGILRFRKAKSKESPGQFCWDSG